MDKDVKMNAEMNEKEMRGMGCMTMRRWMRLMSSLMRRR